MQLCEFCGRTPAQLARTATRVWLGCPHCHRTWNVEAGSWRTPTGESVLLSTEMDAPPRMSLLRGSLVAALVVALALSARIALHPALGDASPFLLFTPAVVIAAVYGGVVPGILATALSTWLGSHFFLTSPGEPLIERWDRVVLFIVVGGVITATSALVRRSRHELAASLWREQRARAMAEAADRAKDDFLALVSHELQTPMSVILGWTDVLRHQRASPESLDRALAAVERNAQMLSRLVDDVLDRSRIATGTLRLDRQLISLTTVVRAAVDQMREKIESAGLQLDIAVPTSECSILGDSIRLQQVFTNLLSNARKFTGQPGRISIELTVRDNAAHVEVTDTGSGISPDALPHIFDAFRQNHETLHQSRGGLGLGLAIARYIVEEHEGSIAVASDGPGRGTVFTVTLPLASRPFVSQDSPSPDPCGPSSFAIH